MHTPAIPGDILLGKYRVERVLGRGGMGVVVAARHLELGQLYALKFLLSNDLEDRDAVERFLREARAAAQLTSEHVARVHDVGRLENSTPYMVMEYLDGCDLKVLLARQGPLPIDDALRHVLHVCDAISEAHAHGIIHRDLKPANLFIVRRHNGSACVKVLDFGISKVAGPEEVDLTKTNMALGSTMYMSPEQMLASKTVDGRTDIWALGVILYELLTGSSPFRAGSRHEVIAKVLQEEPQPLRAIRPEVPECIVEVVRRCLSKRRDDRYPTIEQLTQALREVVPPAPPPRASTPSMTDFESAGGTTTITKKRSPVATLEATRMPAATTPGPAQGEPTSISQTGKPKGVNRRRHVQVAMFVTAGLILAGGGWVGWRQVTISGVTPNTVTTASSDAIASAEAISTSSWPALVDPNRPVPMNTHEPRNQQTSVPANASSTARALATTKTPNSTPEKTVQSGKTATTTTTATTLDPPSSTSPETSRKEVRPFD